jgi:uncharacterized protein YbjT (DUF2867 family)
MEKVLIAGATGYLGKCAIKAFKERGYYVRALARNVSKLDDVREYVDDVFEAQVTQPETLTGVCDNIDYIFSSLGLTKQTDKVSHMDVDYKGNKSLLDLGLKASVKKFIYISVFAGNDSLDIEIFRVKEKFVQYMMNSGMDYAIIRPTGFFSDMYEIWKMAKSGRVYLLGKGQARGNPIDGNDLAHVCVDAVTKKQKEIEIGGPDTFTQQQIAELAFKSLNKESKITKIPEGLVRSITWMANPFMSPRMRGGVEFLLAALLNNFVAPAYPGRSLEAYFNELSKTV